MNQSNQPQPQLARSLGLVAVLFYGIGDILGAGIYALVGKIAGITGTMAWVSFAVAMVVVAFTALSYSELGSRFPKSAGAAYFCQEAFRLPDLTMLIGWMVLFSGVMSMAGVSHAFAGYLQLALPEAWRDHALLTRAMQVLFLVVLAGINFWGIRESSMANIICTMVEVTGLLIVLTAGVLYLNSEGPIANAAVAAAVPPDVADQAVWWLVAQGAALAFFAFIGFEDIVNVAEEVHSPRRIIPIAILSALAVAGLMYIAVVWVTSHVVPQDVLANSKAPLMEVVRRGLPRVPDGLFTVIATFAVANSALLNFVMASRLVYGMSRQGLLPDWLGHVHRQRRTPHRALLAVFVLAVALALSGTLVYLAGTTSVLLLLVFTAVNLALATIKRRNPRSRGFRVPLAVPVIGAVLTLCLAVFVPVNSMITGLGVGAMGILLIVWRRMRAPTQAATYKPDPDATMHN